MIKEPFDLFRSLTLDLEELTECSLNRDLLTLEQRYKHEGLPFLTRTLPAFSDSIFQSLKVGAIQHPSSFKRKGALPAFLHGLTSRVFDDKTGILLGDPCYVSIYAIRQLCYLLYKYEVAYTPEQEAQAFLGVKELDCELDGQVLLDPFDKVFLVAESVISDIFSDVDWSDIVPRQGPGSTNMGNVAPWEKYYFGRCRVSEQFDESYFVASSALLTADNIMDDEIFAHTDEVQPVCLRGLRVSKVSAVPKNSKGPRVISAESSPLMWLQLGVGDLMVDVLQKHPLSRGHVNFHDQTINARLAVQGSRDGSLATLDMSSASDRVARILCAQLLPTKMFRVLDGIRSTHTRFPDGSEIELHKMAPMGNGFCFPLESLVFWALAVASIAVRMDEVMTTDEVISSAAALVYTYGDDLIVPTEYAETVMADLERYGFRFNRDKSYWTGPFRESCGTDAFRGVDITPLKIKKLVPRRRSDSESIVAWAQMASEWSCVLPHLSKSMLKTVYAAIGFKPFYPAGWSGRIGEPCELHELKGREVEAGEIIKRGKVKLRGEGFRVLKEPHELAPSDGKIVTLFETTTKTLRPNHEVYPEVHRYLRALVDKPRRESKYRQVVPEATGDSATFSLRYATQLKAVKRFVA